MNFDILFHILYSEIRTQSKEYSGEQRNRWSPFDTYHMRSVSTSEARPNVCITEGWGETWSWHQILTDRIKIDKGEILSESDERTRGHCLKLKKPHVSTVVRQQCFPVWVVNDWNNLLCHVMSASSVKAFKTSTRLNKHWIGYMHKVCP